VAVTVIRLIVRDVPAEFCVQRRKLARVVAKAPWHVLFNVGSRSLSLFSVFTPL